MESFRDVVSGVLHYLEIAVPLGLVVIVLVVAVLQRTVFREMERRRMLGDVLPMARKAIVCAGALLVLTGIAWALETAGVLDFTLLRRYSIQVSLVVLGLLLIYLYRPVAKKTDSR